MRTLAIALLLAACGAKTAPPASEPHEVAVASVDAGGAGAIVTTDADAPRHDGAPPLPQGWQTVDFKTGRVDHVGRDKAIEAIKLAPVHALVRVASVIEECSSAGGTHVFVEPAFSKEPPFRTAHLGGHGAHVGPFQGMDLFVAGLETHPPGSFGNGRGWCLEKAPSYDADVVAIVPVRSEGEGMRLLTELAR